MPSIFTRIIQGEIPCYKIAEDDRFFAFLDINPLTKGHTLVMPKEEIDSLFDYDEATLSDILPFARRIAKALEKTMPCRRVGMAVMGMEVPHAHIHLIPIEKESDMLFDRPKMTFSPNEMQEIADAIRRAL